MMVCLCCELLCVCCCCCALLGKNSLLMLRLGLGLCSGLRRSDNSGMLACRGKASTLRFAIVGILLERRHGFCLVCVSRGVMRCVRTLG
jgi:hypothetical protein